MQVPFFRNRNKTMDIRYLDRTLTSSINAILFSSAIAAFPEHFARHSYAIQIEIEYLVAEQKFDLILNKGSCAFLKRGDQQIELILPEGAPEHMGWVVSSLEDFTKLYEILVVSPWRNEFTLLKDHRINKPELKAVMFRYKNGAVVQFVWRQTPLFPA